MSANSYWSETFNNDAKIESQGIVFSHTAVRDWNSWNGFTLSTVTDNTNHDNTWYPDNQWGSMTKGGYDGEGSPFIVAYWDAYNDGLATNIEERINMIDVRGCAYDQAEGVYVTLSPWTYYANVNGVAPARAFVKGDWLKLIATGYITVNGVVEQTLTAEYLLADYTGNELIQASSWNWFDLSALGVVDYITFTLESTDNGQWGINTPTYFCIDKLTFKNANSSIENINLNKKSYRSGSVIYNLPENALVQIYDLNGRLIKEERAVGATLNLSDSRPVVIRIISKDGVQSLK